MKKISQSIKEETDDDLKREVGEEYFAILKRFWDIGMNLARTELPDGSLRYDISYTIDPTLWRASDVEARKALRAKEKSSTYSTNSLDEAIRVGLAMSSSRPDWAKNYTNKLPLHMSTLQKYIKLANLLDESGHHDAAKLVDDFVSRASLELEMEKEVEVEEKDEDDDDDKDEKKTKKKKITLSFD